jgi:hypothetical protein
MLEFCDSISCRNRSWDSSLQSVPLAGDRLPLSRQPGFLAVIHRRAETYDSRSFTAGFPDVHAFAQLPGSPDGYGLPFHSLNVLPGRPGSRAAEPLHSASFIYFEASLPPASPFATGLGFPAPAGRYSLGILPL